ncbi:MAG TPA: DNA (cytosine-5-)-methyltransferase [Ktedonobacteraceae bacterium]
MAANHFSPGLSQLDQQIVRAVPPGGNWKDIPEEIPSKRLSQIRESYSNGEGSRSTYYGRLHPDTPSYTINTWISRPGNGCHIHYEQDRLISQREAARLQSFPDSFVFLGSKTSINQQIGNAVPPLMAFQIARRLGPPGFFVDLFSGAGGLTLGFVWAGWAPVIANDIDKNFLSTYSRNIDPKVIEGDITDPSVFSQLQEVGLAARHEAHRRPLFVLGGPPCQGFSTAGNRRSMEDERNHLFKHYVRYIEAIQPDGFVFENVMGLTNMDSGAVFAQVHQALTAVARKTVVWKLGTEDYGVPQRRKRLIIVGRNDETLPIPLPEPICSQIPGGLLFRGPITVKEALDDLPAIGQGEDGSHLAYRHEPSTSYQRLMRSLISPEQFLTELSQGI